MKIRVKVYNDSGLFHNRYDLDIEDDYQIHEASEDIEAFLNSQFIELEDEGDGYDGTD